MFKRFSLGLGAAAVLMGIAAFAVPEKANAFNCRPSKIPVGWYGTGAPCSQVCESERWVSQNGMASTCIVYGPKF